MVAITLPVHFTTIFDQLKATKIKTEQRSIHAIYIEKRRHRHKATEFINRCSIVINRQRLAGKSKKQNVCRLNFSKIHLNRRYNSNIYFCLACKSEDEMREDNEQKKK